MIIAYFDTVTNINCITTTRMADSVTTMAGAAAAAVVSSTTLAPGGGTSGDLDGKGVVEEEKQQGCNSIDILNLECELRRDKFGDNFSTAYFRVSVARF